MKLYVHSFCLLVLLTCTCFAAQVPGRITLKTAVIIYDPIMSNEWGSSAHGWTLSAEENWGNPSNIIFNAKKYWLDCTRGMVDCEIVYWTNFNMQPMSTDGIRRSTSALYSNINEGTSYDMGTFSERLCLENDTPTVFDGVRNGSIDQMWVVHYPHGPAAYETRMMGRGASWCNSSGIYLPSDRCVMGVYFSAERPETIMENCGHAAESILSTWFNNFTGNGDYHDDAWSGLTPYTNICDLALFTRCRENLSGTVSTPNIFCGTVHHAPNSTASYDWKNYTPVFTKADSFYNYPDVTAPAEWQNCLNWGNGVNSDHMRWWFHHMPSTYGLRRGKLMNWMTYFYNLWHASYPLGSDQPRTESCDPFGWFTYQIEVPPGTTSVWISVDSPARAVYHGIRKEYIPLFNRYGDEGSKEGVDDYTVSRVNSKTWRLDANNPLVAAKGLEGKWYVTFGGAAARPTELEDVTVECRIRPYPAATPVTVDVTAPASGAYVHNNEGAIAWTVDGCDHGIRGVKIAYSTNGIGGVFIPVCADFAYELVSPYKWYLPPGVSSNAIVRVTIEDVYGTEHTGYSGTFNLNYSASWHTLPLPEGKSLFEMRDARVSLGSDSDYLYYMNGTTKTAQLYRIRKGSHDPSEWELRAPIPMSRATGYEYGLGSLAYFDGALWTGGYVLNVGFKYCVFKYDIAANAWTIGGNNSFLPRRALAPVSADKIFCAKENSVYVITDWTTPGFSTVGGAGWVSMPWDSCIDNLSYANGYVYFLKHEKGASTFVRVKKSDNSLTTLTPPPFPAGLGCALEYLPGSLFGDGKDRVYAIRGGTDYQRSGTWENGMRYDVDTLKDNLGVYDVAADTWHVESLPFSVDDGSEMCLVSNVLYILAADGVLNPVRFRDFSAPWVEITNTTTHVAFETAQLNLAGFSGLAEGMWWTNTTTGASGVLTASGFWTATIDVNTGINDILVFASNSFGRTGMDNISIVRDAPAAFLNITNNTPMTVLTDTTTVTIGGTNCTGNGTDIIGDIWWENAANGSSGFIPASAGWSIAGIPLSYNDNLITVYGSNAYDVIAQDSITVTRETVDDGFLDILSTDETVSWNIDTYDIYVTNSPEIIGNVNWHSVQADVSGAVPANPLARIIFNIPLANGANNIVVYGTNITGYIAADTVTITRVERWINVPLPALNFDNFRSWLAGDNEGYLYAARWDTDGDIYKLPFAAATNTATTAGDWASIPGPANFAGGNNDNGNGAWIVGGSNGYLYAVLKLSSWTYRGWGRLSLSDNTWTTTPNQLDGANYGIIAVENAGTTYLYGQHFGWTRIRGYRITDDTTMAYEQTADNVGVNMTHWGGDGTIGNGYYYFYDQGGEGSTIARFVRAPLSTLPIPANTMNAASPWSEARALNTDKNRKAACKVTFVPAAHSESGTGELWVLPLWNSGYVSYLERYNADTGDFIEEINLPFTIDTLTGYDLEYQNGYVFVMDGRAAQRTLWAIATDVPH